MVLQNKLIECGKKFAYDGDNSRYNLIIWTSHNSHSLLHRIHTTVKMKKGKAANWAIYKCPAHDVYTCVYYLLQLDLVMFAIMLTVLCILTRFGRSL